MSNEVEILVTSKNNAAGGFDSANASASKFSGALDKVRGVATVASAAIVGGLTGVAKAVGDAASQQQQAFGGVDAVFKQNSATVKKWAADAANSVGLSKTEYATFANIIGSSFKAAGVPMDQLAQKTDSVIKIGADLAATFGGTTKDAVEALSAAYRGEFDPLERYGVALKQSDVNAQMAANGTDKLTGQAAKLAQQQAITQLITKQSADAQGQFGREANTAAGAAERQKAAWANVQAQLGEQLLPVMTQLAQKLQEIIGWLSQHTAVATVAAVVIGGLALAVIGYNVVMAVVPVVTAAWTAAQWLLNAALNANPIGIVVIALAAFVAAIIYAWNNSQTFRNIVIGAWEAIKGVTLTVFGFISSFISGTINTVRGILNWFGGLGGLFSGWIGNARNAIVNGFNSAVAFVGGIPGRILGALGNMGSLLYQAGVNVVQGLINGIRNMIGAVGSAIGSVASKIRAALPFSPAKEGPLSGSGSPDISGRKIPQMIAEGMLAGVGDISAAANQLAAAADIGAGLGDVVRFGDVSTEKWQQLLDAGWKGRADDHMEALYRPAGGAPSTGVVASSGRQATVTFGGNVDGAFATAFMRLVREGQIQIST